MPHFYIHESIKGSFKITLDDIVKLHSKVYKKHKKDSFSSD